MVCVPVISSYISSIPELIKDGETGILIAEKNPEELYRSILELSNNNTLYAMISKNSIKLANKVFDSNKTANSLLDIFTN